MRRVSAHDVSGQWPARGRQAHRVEGVRRRLRALAGRRRIDTEVGAELRFHVQMETDANVAAGMAPEEARRVAMRDLGGLTQTVESVRKVRETAFDALARDVRIAARMLVRSPSFSVAVIMTLALGIGANAAIFSVVDALLIRRLPYPNTPTGSFA